MRGVHETWAEHIGSLLGCAIFLAVVLPVMVPAALAMRVIDATRPEPDQ